MFDLIDSIATLNKNKNLIISQVATFGAHKSKSSFSFPLHAVFSSKSPQNVLSGLLDLVTTTSHPYVAIQHFATSAGIMM